MKKKEGAKDVPMGKDETGQDREFCKNPSFLKVSSQSTRHATPFYF